MRGGEYGGIKERWEKTSFGVEPQSFGEVSTIILLIFCRRYIIMYAKNRTEAPLLQRRNRQALGLKKGMGSGIFQIPALTNTVGIENRIRWRKPVIGVT